MISRIGCTAAGFATSFGGLCLASKINHPTARLVALAGMAFSSLGAVYYARSENPNVKNFSQGYLGGYVVGSIYINFSKIREVAEKIKNTFFKPYDTSGAYTVRIVHPEAINDGAIELNLDVPSAIDSVFERKLASDPTVLGEPFCHMFHLEQKGLQKLELIKQLIKEGEPLDIFPQWARDLYNGIE